MQRQDLFRKQALKHVVSPDDLDQVITVTDPRGWAALAALGLVVAAIVLWAVFGTLPITLTGRGAFQPVGGTASIVSLHEGQLVDSILTDRLEVRAGQAVAQIQTPQGTRIPLLSPTTGRVSEVVAPNWSPVRVGQVVAYVRPVDAPLQAVVYVPADIGSSVRPEMSVSVAPASATGQSSGFIEGRVVRVAEDPASREQLALVLPTPNAVQSLLIAIPQPLRVDVELLRDPANPARFRWSSGTGNDALVRSGVEITATVRLGTAPPIAVIVPALAGPQAP